MILIMILIVLLCICINNKNNYREDMEDIKIIYNNINALDFCNPMLLAVWVAIVNRFANSSNMYIVRAISIVRVNSLTALNLLSCISNATNAIIRA